MDEILTAQICPYCGSSTELKNSSIVYQRDYGWLWICSRFPECNTYVGCHKGTTTPLGRLADKQLRLWKGNAHALFDRKWKKGKMKRGQAYRWLADKLGIEPEKTHIGMFDVEQCKRVVEICKNA